MQPARADETLDARHRREIAEMTQRQQTEMGALIQKALSGDMPRVGDRVLLQCGAEVQAGFVAGGPHFDGTSNVQTDSGELHLYCRPHRIRSLDIRRRSSGFSGSFGLTSSGSCCSESVSRRGSFSSSLDIGSRRPSIELGNSFQRGAEPLVRLGGVPGSVQVRNLSHFRPVRTFKPEDVPVSVRKDFESFETGLSSFCFGFPASATANEQQPECDDENDMNNNTDECTSSQTDGPPALADWPSCLSSPNAGPCPLDHFTLGVPEGADEEGDPEELSSPPDEPPALSEWPIGPFEHLSTIEPFSLPAPALPVSQHTHHDWAFLPQFDGCAEVPNWPSGDCEHLQNDKLSKQARRRRSRRNRSGLGPKITI
ncbi:hypothetical protein DIPPA_18373 [Diplonema papillatum]|nr:hypothetical protein DIPPA_18373 [Diplonema papillatum]